MNSKDDILPPLHVGQEVLAVDRWDLKPQGENGHSSYSIPCLTTGTDGAHLYRG